MPAIRSSHFEHTQHTSPISPAAGTSHAAASHAAIPHASNGRAAAPIRTQSNIIRSWKTRLLQGVGDKSFARQVAFFGSGKTGRDYCWNGLGQAASGLMFPLLVIITTQLCGVFEAGMFALAFVFATLISFIALFGIRTFQVSDIDEHDSFASYQLQRLLSCALALLVAWLYLSFRSYNSAMHTTSWALVIFKCIDALADVYEGRLQQYNKLYLAGISQSIRCFGASLLFIVSLTITRSVAISSVILCLVAAASFVLVSFPLAKIETPPSRRGTVLEIKELCLLCAPACLIQLLYALIDAVPKFVMEGMLGYEQQLYFNAIYFPAMAIVLIGGLLYKPQLTYLSNTYVVEKNTRAFVLHSFSLMGAILVVGAVFFVIFSTWGAAINSLLYGVSFTRIAEAQNLMIIAGVVCALIDFVFQLLCVMRQQARATLSYCACLVVVCMLSASLIATMGFSGAVWAYTASMLLLLVLLCIRLASVLLRSS